MPAEGTGPALKIIPQQPLRRSHCMSGCGVRPGLAQLRAAQSTRTACRCPLPLPTLSFCGPRPWPMHWPMQEMLPTTTPTDSGCPLSASCTDCMAKHGRSSSNWRPRRQGMISPEPAGQSSLESEALSLSRGTVIHNHVRNVPTGDDGLRCHICLHVVVLVREHRRSMPFS